MDFLEGVDERFVVWRKVRVRVGRDMAVGTLWLLLPLLLPETVDSGISVSQS